MTIQISIIPALTSVQKAEVYRKDYYAKNKEKYQAYAKAYAKENQELITHNAWVRLLFKKYGLTEAQFHVLLDKQDGKCGICEAGIRGIINRYRLAHVDHCHSTGKVRGMLCRKCNVGIGMFGDGHEVASKAVEYLQNANWQ